MTRFLLPFLLAATISGAAEAATRGFTVTSFDRIRVEAPFDVVLATGKPPSARAEGSAEALDTVDLRVEGRTLIVRQRSGWNGAGRGVPARITLGTPDLRTVTLVGSGRIQVDRMKGLSVSLALAGPGQLKVGRIEADRLDLLAAGSGTVELAGTVKTGRLGVEGQVVLDAAALAADDLVIQAAGNAEVRASAKRSVDLSASAAATVTLQPSVACRQKVTGAATVTGCR